MAQSSLETAPVSQYVEADVTGLLKARKYVNEGKEKNDQLTVTSFILRAMAIAVKEQERFRMQLGADGDSFVLKDDVNIGIAVGTSEGLTVPVLRNADAMSIQALNAETAFVAQKARDGELSPDAYHGGVITLTNMGMFGVTAFTPIINQPEASILGVGTPAERVVFKDGEYKNHSFMTLSLTYDHRIINGTEAALFQQRIKELLEEPEQLL
ncbi:MAG: 2-oxo acid dehydrogenase subunit E2 [Clostridiales bacterium]|nr:2-oxo acid dehydrogenase subunit E2 [Clostridiales bacterium]